MKVKRLYIVICILLLRGFGYAENINEQKCYLLDHEMQITDSISVSEITIGQENKTRPNPLLSYFRTKQKKNKKITAALLAFPFPFGIVGLHRIYLGTAPYVPVVYIASAGGVIGILPFIDFCVLLLDKDEKRYIENKKVFMWVN